MAGPGQRHGDVPQEPAVAVAVEGGGVPQVLRDAEERLADQERPEGEGQERHDQALVRVEPAEVDAMV